MNLLLTAIIFSQFIFPYQTRVFLDSDARFLVYARVYQGEIISIDSIKSLSDYLSDGLASHNRELLLAELKRKVIQQGGYASKGLFGTFEIPLPKGRFSEFMGETGKLDVGGYVKITLGGSETFMPNLPGQAGMSLLPELEMKQEMAINLDGQVGDRIRVFIDHNSERVNESENKVTVTYKGREDEVIQEIQGGDTQLSIPATAYTGDIPSHKGLFGIKSTAKFGPLDLVAIASNEQTQHQEWDFEGSTQATSDTVWDEAYQKRRFFWLGTNDSIIQQSLQIYIDDNNYQNNNQGITYYGIAQIDTNDDNIPDDTARTEIGYFTLKRLNDDYYFIPHSNIIELKQNLQVNQEVMGVIYQKILPNGDTVTVGRYAQADSDTIVLKLICPKNPDTLSYTWNYELKNYYQIVSPGARLDSLRIYYVTSGNPVDIQDDIPFIELLGLDQDKDGMIDENRVYFPGRGLLIFPDLQPFISDKLKEKDPEIYKNPYHMVGHGKYFIYKKTIEAKPVYDLPPDVVDVKVYIDGVEQEEEKDYHVDYDEGKLEFKKPIPPTARVKIHAEYTPFFSAAQKSLVGMRGSVKSFGNATLGSSFFYRTESYPAEHTRLREEPFNRSVWELDFAWPATLPFLTKFIDWLPLLETEAESRLNVSFEGAYSFSNLNSRGDAYLDDLESSTIISTDVSVNRTNWVLASMPAGKDTTNFVHKRIIWFNPQKSDRLQAGDIYEEPQDPSEIVDVLEIIFQPDDTLSFGGLTQYIYGENLDDCENLEIIIKGSGGRVHFDLAQEIREDQLRRDWQGNIVGLGLLDDEDNDRNGSWNQELEDTGLDGIFGDDDEKKAGDDGNDDYGESDYTGGINGTEKNGIWDTEDIDRNGLLNDDNIYYSYSVDLDSTRFLIEDAGLKSGWKMFRIPIKDSLVPDAVYGQPDWHNIKYVRIWFDHFSKTETLFIYKLSATGSRWKNYGIIGDTLTIDSTEVFTITPVNTKTHPYFKSPYPLQRDPLTGEIKSEGGMELRLENIKEGHTCVIHRRTDENEDYRAYDTLTYYLNVHHTNPLIAIRFGTDSLNYYEYATEYKTGALGLNDYRLFKIALKRFTELKKLSKGQDTLSDSVYTVVGNPSLSVNQFFELRITNQYTTPLTDTIWFEDIKLTSPHTEVGSILRGSASLNMADIATVSFAYDQSNGRFKRLSESKDMPTSSAGRNYSVSSNISLNKFLPDDWGFSIPLGFSYRNSVQHPRFSYLSNDIELTKSEQEREKSTSITKSYTLHLSKMGSRNWLLKQTLDNLSLDHDRSSTYSRSVQNCDTAKIANYRATYTLNPKFSLKVFNQLITLLPNNISLSALYTDNFLRSYYRPSPDSAFRLSSYGSQHRRTLNPTFSLQYNPLRILTSNYSFAETRDSVSEKRRFGEEVGRNQTFNATFSPDLKIFSPRLTFNSSYNEDHRFEIRQEEDFRNVSNTGRYGIDGQVDIRRIIKFFTALRDEKKDSLQIPGSPGWIAKQIEEFVQYLQNPTISYSRQRSSNYLNVKKRPELKYQFGIIDTIPPEDIDPTSLPGRSISDMYSINSGMSYKFFSLQGGYSGQVNRTLNYGGVIIKTGSSSYPNSNITISKVEILPFLKKYSRSSSVNSGFNQTFEKRYEITGDSTTLTSDSRTISFSPVLGWQTNWMNGLSSTININYSETVSNDYSGTAVVTSKSLNRGGSASFAYTFSAPRGIRLPFLKGVKFSSNLSVNLSVSYSENTNYSGDLSKPLYDSSVMNTNLGLSYNFSSSITGGANFDYSKNKEKVSNQDTRRVGLNIWVNINF